MEIGFPTTSAVATGRGPIPTSRQRLLGTGTAMSGTFTVFGCYRAPAHFDAVQIVLISLVNDTTNAFKASVIAPAQYNDGINGKDAAGAAITPTPVTWGTTQPRNPRNPGGGAATTFITGGSGTAPNQIEARVFSDIIQLPSLDRTDTPGARPLLMVRLFGTNIPGMASAGLSGVAASSYKQVNADHWCQYEQTNDRTATASGVAVASTTAITQWAPSIEIIYYLRGSRVATIAGTGDSIDMGWGNSTAVNTSAGNMNGWQRRFASLCDGVAPTGFVAWHRDGFTGTRFNEMANNSLLLDDAAGVTHLFIKPSSVNNWRPVVAGAVSATVPPDLRRVSLMLDQCARLGVVPILVYPWAGQDVGSASELAIRSYIDGYKARGGFTFDARAVVSADGTTTSNTIKDAYLTKDSGGATVDTTHINDAGEAAIAAEAFRVRQQWGLA